MTKQQLAQPELTGFSYEEMLTEGMVALSNKIGALTYPEFFMEEQMGIFPPHVIEVIETMVCNNGFPEMEDKPQLVNLMNHIFRLVCIIIYNLRVGYPIEPFATTLMKKSKHLLNDSEKLEFNIQNYFERHNTLRRRRLKYLSEA